MGKLKFKINCELGELNKLANFCNQSNFSISDDADDIVNNLNNNFNLEIAPIDEGGNTLLSKWVKLSRLTRSKTTISGNLNKAVINGDVLKIVLANYAIAQSENQIKGVSPLEKFFEKIDIPTGKSIQQKDLRTEINDLNTFLNILFINSRLEDFNYRFDSKFTLVSKEGTTKTDRATTNQPNELNGFFRTNYIKFTKKSLITKSIIIGSVLSIFFLFVFLLMNSKYTELNRDSTYYADRLYSNQLFDDAVKEYEKILFDVNSVLRNEDKGDLYGRIGTSHFDAGKKKGDKHSYQLSISNWESAVKMFKNNPASKSYALVSLAEVYDMMFEVTSKKIYLNKMKKCLDAIESQNRIISGLTYLAYARFHLNSNKLEESVQKTEKAIGYIRKGQKALNNNNAMLNDLANAMIERYHATGDVNDLQAAYRVYQKENKLVSKGSNEIGYAMNLFGLAHCQTHLSDSNSQEILTNALTKLKEAVHIYEDAEINHLISSTYFLIGKVEHLLFPKSKNPEHLFRSIQYLKKSLTSTNYNRYSRSYIQAVLIQAHNYLALSEVENELENLEKSKIEFEKIQFVEFEKFPKLHINISGYLAAVYFKIGEINGQDYQHLIDNLIVNVYSLVRNENVHEIKHIAKKEVGKLEIVSRQTKATNYIYQLMWCEMLAGDDQQNFDETIHLLQQFNNVASKLPVKEVTME